MNKNFKKQENKKRYKNWKLYASVLGTVIIGAGAGLGIYFGINNHSHHEAKKTDLNNLELNTILSFPVVNQQAAFDLFIKSNATITDLKDNLEIVSYNPSDYNKLGTLEIQAKTSSKKYTGTITITIPEKNQTNLNQLITNTTIQGTETMTEQEAFNAFLTANNSWTNLSDFVEYSSFTAATYTSNGSLTITAKANSAFSGSINITINEIGQIDLNTLGLKTLIQGSENITAETVFNIFINNNKNIADLQDKIEIEANSFITPTYETQGSLEIKGKTNDKYNGIIKITIDKITKTDLNTLELNTTTIPGTANMSQEAAFQSFLDTNENILGDSLTLDQVELSNFKTVQILQDGLLTITVKKENNSKYTGTINVTLKYTLNTQTLIDSMTYLSNNDMLNFNIPVGTNSNDLFNIVVNQFKNSFSYVYGKNISNFSIDSVSGLPTQEQLNTKGYVWQPWRIAPNGRKISNLILILNVFNTDGQKSSFSLFNIICTVTIV